MLLLSHYLRDANAITEEVEASHGDVYDPRVPQLSREYAVATSMLDNLFLFCIGSFSFLLCV